MSVLSAKRVSRLSLGFPAVDDVFAGFDVYAGQTVQYLIVNSKSRKVNERVLATELLKPKTSYDKEKYLEMLISAGETLLSVFGYNSEKIKDRTFYREKQMLLD